MLQRIYKRNGHYYYRQWIPLDLRLHFGSKTDITKSLKTNDKNQAILHGSTLQQQFNLVFSIMRSGQFSPDIIETIVCSTIPKIFKNTQATAPTAKEKSSTPQSLLLSKLIQPYPFGTGVASPHYHAHRAWVSTSH